jgi:HK97 family phage portal protein
VNLIQRTRAAISILRGKPLQKKALSGVDDRGWQLLYDYNTSMSAWQKDIVLDRDGVLSNWAAFACMTLIAGDIGKCCIELYMQDGDIWTPTQLKPYSQLLKKPNHFQTRQQFIENWVLSKLSWGNTYVLKQRNQNREVVGQYILDPGRVYPLVSENGDVFYQLNRDNLTGVHGDFPAVPASEIIHDRFNCLFHPLVGLSPLFASALAATQGLKIQTNSAKFFENMSRPSGILVAPGSISQESADALKAKWDANFSGDKIGKVAVLGDGLKYESMGVTAVDAQMVEQAKFSAETVCSTFHVPSFKIGIGAIPAGQKVEDMNQIYYSDCLHALMDSIQTLQTEGLGLKDDVAVMFDLEDLLKMDSRTLTEVQVLRVGGGISAPDEARSKFNLKPVPGGKLPYLQQQNYSLEALAKRDAQGDPFAAANTAPAAPVEDEPMSDDEMDENMRSLVVEFKRGLELA